MSDYRKITPSCNGKTRKTQLVERLGRLQPAYFDEVLSVEKALTYAQSGNESAQTGGICGNYGKNLVIEGGIL
ncbi:MAG: hypothetical protein LBB72_05350 [Spirochaetaceae bacterium]|jgi:hypothetical protein|nr:hypothetical protein [Spirochaetaceae bacterium]